MMNSTNSKNGNLKYMTPKITCICRKYSDISDMLVRSNSTRLHVVQSAMRHSSSCDEALNKSAFDNNRLQAGCVTEAAGMQQKVLTCKKCGGIRIEENVIDSVPKKHGSGAVKSSSAFVTLRKRYSNIKKALTPNNNNQSTGAVSRRNIPRSASAGTLKSRANHMVSAGSTANEFSTNHNSESNGLSFKAAQPNEKANTGVLSQGHRRKISWADRTACTGETAHPSFPGDIEQMKSSTVHCNEIDDYKYLLNGNKNKHSNKNTTNDAGLNPMNRNNVAKDDSNCEQICTDHREDNSSSDDIIQFDNNNKRSLSITNQWESHSHQDNNNNNNLIRKERNHFAESKLSSSIKLPNEIPSSCTEQEGRASVSASSDTKPIMKASTNNSKDQRNHYRRVPNNNSNSNNYKTINVNNNSNNINSPTVINGGHKYIYFFESNEESSRPLLPDAHTKKVLGKSVSWNGCGGDTSNISVKQDSKLNCDIDVNNNTTNNNNNHTANKDNTTNNKNNTKPSFDKNTEQKKATSKSAVKMLGNSIVKKPYAVEDLYIKSEPIKQQHSSAPLQDENIFQSEYLSRFLDSENGAGNKTSTKVSSNQNFDNNNIENKIKNKVRDTTTVDAPTVTNVQQPTSLKEIRALVENIIRHNLDEKVFDTSKVTEWCKDVSNLTRDRVKALSNDQQKVIVQTYIGPRSTQDGTQVAIKCQRESADNFITVAFEGTQFFVWVSLFLGVN